MNLWGTLYAKQNIWNDGYANFAGNMHLWGTLYAKQNIWNEGSANSRYDINIRPTVLKQSGKKCYGGSDSIGNYWYMGRGAYNVGQNNFVIGSNMIDPISNGVTQAYVRFQINTNRTAYFTGKVHALDGLEVRGNLSANNNAYITTLQAVSYTHLTLPTKA